MSSSSETDADAVGPSPTPGVRHRPPSGLIDEDPRDTLRRIVSAEEDRLAWHRIQLAEARNALARLDREDPVATGAGVVPLTVEVAPQVIHDLVDESQGPIRDAAISAMVGSAVDTELMAHLERVIASGREYRGVYDDGVLVCPRAMEEIAAWAAVGERQRLVRGVPSEFAIYGETAVVAVATWGDPQADYVLIRTPMLVQSFIALFERLWESSYPFPSPRAVTTEEDGPLLDLLARGFKDEAIARYLGWSLRTVRRRVARLMDELGADTRFQMGAEAMRGGRLDAPEVSGDAYDDQRRTSTRWGSR